MIKHRLSKLAYSLILALLIFGAFLYIYIIEISPTHSYLGFNFKELTIWDYLISIGFFLLPLLWLPKNPQKPSDITIWLLYIFSYVPTTFICFHIIENIFPVGIFLLLSILIALIITDLSRRHHRHLNTLLNNVSEKTIDNFIITLSIFLCIYIFSLSGFNLNLDISNIYERRLIVREESFWLSRYILSFCRSVVTIVATYLFLIKKNIISLLILIACPIGIFSYDGTKSALLIPILLVVIFFIIIYKKGLNTFLLLILFLIISSIIEYKFYQTNIISDSFVRRALAVPGLLNTAFWEYYSMHDKVMMADSIGRFFIDPSWVTASTYVIGYEYFNNPDINANTGIWMGAYAHFGFIGVIFISAIAGFILGLIDNLTKEKSILLGYLVCAYIGILWTEQMLHTSMLTGGIVYIIVFLMLYCKSSILSHRMSSPTYTFARRL